MFEAILFSAQNKHDIDKPIDLGMLIEGMLFYRKTTVIANKAILTQLIRYFGVERLIVLIDEEILNLVYLESFLGVRTDTINGTECHEVVKFSSPQHKFDDELSKICIEVTGKSGEARRQALKIQDKIHVSQYDHIILEGARQSILDPHYVESAAKIIIKELVPEFEYVSAIRFSTAKTSEKILVDTNIDFVEVNKLYHKKVPPEHSSITSASILSHLLELEKELYFSSSHLSELASSNLSAKLGESKIEYVIKKSTQSRDALTKFTDFIFNDAKAIREAVNSNKVNVDDLILVLQKTKKFKKWLEGKSPDGDLIKDYYKEVTKETLSDKLPCKTIRWGLFTGVGVLADVYGTGGLVGTMAGLGLSALDGFLVDKLFSGWKPNQFIDGDVIPLIEKSK